jgi:hypothetical protein
VNFEIPLSASPARTNGIPRESPTFFQPELHSIRMAGNKKKDSFETAETLKKLIETLCSIKTGTIGEFESNWAEARTNSQEFPHNVKIGGLTYFHHDRCHENYFFYRFRAAVRFRQYSRG